MQHYVHKYHHLSTNVLQGIFIRGVYCILKSNEKHKTKRHHTLYS